MFKHRNAYKHQGNRWGMEGSMTNDPPFDSELRSVVLDAADLMINDGQFNKIVGERVRPRTVEDGMQGTVPLKPSRIQGLPHHGQFHVQKDHRLLHGGMNAPEKSP
jgi:hypothetical protein